MIDTVIFDMDGTLLNTLDDIVESVNRTLIEFKFPARKKNEIRQFVGNGVNNLFEKALPQNTDYNIRSKCVEFFKKEYSKNMYINTTPYNGILSLLKAIRNSCISTAIVSNKFDKAVKDLSSRYFGDLIDVAIGQSDKISSKPSTNGVYEVMRELRAKKVVFVGDSDIDILTAKNARIPSIAVTWGYRDKECLANANYIAETPAELMKIIKSL
ncbi:HAD family hydrolase [bacterium]|nr:HAD family hydrolase [bacterium]